MGHPSLLLLAGGPVIAAPTGGGRDPDEEQMFNISQRVVRASKARSFSARITAVSFGGTPSGAVRMRSA